MSYRKKKKDIPDDNESKFPTLKLHHMMENTLKNKKKLIAYFNFFFYFQIPCF